jgi:hypothetical protein
MLHVDLSSGGLFSGETAHAWDLSDAQLRERFLEPRARGDEVWLQGKGFKWDESKLSIYEGPPSNEIEDFNSVLGPAAYALAGSLDEVTDRYITGPPGDALGADSTVGSAIFVVHGSKEGIKEQVVRFLGQLLPEQTPVLVLHEQPNRGRTLIEKFEQTAQEAKYAIVLLTADDEGKAVGAPDFELRGRQNVVFELGFFFGKLDRARVAVLYEDSVARPSDIDGLVYIPLDEKGGWKIQLAREMRDAGLDPDLNRVAG